MQPLQRPAVLLEARGEVIEKLGMRRLLSLRPEIARRVHQSAAKMLLPDAIHEDPRRQRTGIGDNCLRKFAAAATVLESSAGIFRQHRQESPRHCGSDIGRIAANLHANILRLVRLVFNLRAGRPVRQHMQAGLDNAIGQRRFIVRRGSFHLRNLLLQRLHLLRQSLRRRLLVFELLDFPFQFLHPVVPLLGNRGEVRRDDWPVLQPNAGEHAGECVIVLRRDGIKLVVVAAGTRDRQTQKRAANRVNPLFPFLGDHLLDDIVIQLQLFPVGRAEAEKTEGRRFPRLKTGEQIRRELLADKIVVRQIAVDGLHDPVPIEPGPSLPFAPRFGNVAIAS